MFFQCMNNTQKLNNLFTDFEIFISYIAALSHDMGHSNLFINNNHKIDGTNSDF